MDFQICILTKWGYIQLRQCLGWIRFNINISHPILCFFQLYNKYYTPAYSIEKGILLLDYFPFFNILVLVMQEYNE